MVSLLVYVKAKCTLALVAELVDALDSKSSSFESVGSIPTRSTKFCFLVKTRALRHVLLKDYICTVYEKK